MVVLARASGLPARLVTGFVDGEYDEENSRFTITADLSHSWLEIYFPEYGWIPFEPTRGRAPIERAKAEQPQIEPGLESKLEPIMAARARAYWNLVLRVVAGNVVVIFSWWLLEVWWMRQLSPIEAFGRVYELLNRGGGWLNVQPEFGKAPHEYSSRLGARSAELPSTSLNRTP